MSGRWLLSGQLTRILLFGAILLFGGAEAALIIVWLGLQKVRPSSDMIYLFACIAINIVPIILAVKGHCAVQRLRAALDSEREDGASLWISRQFLVTAVIIYVAIIFELILLTHNLK
jgi:hypothetical protein